MGRKKKVKSKEIVESDPEAEEATDDNTSNKKRSTRGGGKNPQIHKKLAYTEMDTSSEEEDPNVCPVCDDRNDPNPTDKKNRMIGCDGDCDKWYHWSCVGINQSNKPGKNDDWFCKKCTNKRTEAGEWKPEESDSAKLDVIPLRESTRSTPVPEVKTLAQKKSYEDKSSLPKVKKGRPPVKRRESKESWVTASNPVPKPTTSSPVIQLPPTVSVSTVSSDAENNSGPDLNRLSRLSGITLSQPKDVRKESNITSASSSTSSQNRSLSKLPPGISIHKETELTKDDTNESTDEKEDSSFLADVSHQFNDSDKSTKNNDPQVTPTEVLSPRIKLIKVNEESKTSNEIHSNLNQEETSPRSKRESTARIRGTLCEDSISDEDLFGTRKIPYKKKITSNVNPESTNDIEPTPVEELLGDEDLNSETKNTLNQKDKGDKIKKRGRPKKNQDSVASKEHQMAFREVNGLRVKKSSVSKSVSDDEDTQNPDETSEDKLNVSDEWKPVRDESGRKGLSLITKTTDSKNRVSLVVKNLDFSCDADTDTSALSDNNEHSSSRLVVDDGEAVGEPSSDKVSLNDTEKSAEDSEIESTEKENNSESKMDLSQASIFTNNLDELMPNLDDVLGLNKGRGQINSQHDEAQIQKITSNLEATGASILQQQTPSSFHQPRPAMNALPNTSFSHQLPQTILQPQQNSITVMNPALIHNRPPLAAAALRTPSADSGLGGSNSSTPTSLPSSAAPSGVWDMFDKELESFADGDIGDSPKKDKNNIKVLTPMKLNEKASDGPPVPRTIVLAPPTQNIQVKGVMAATPTRIVVQNPAAFQPQNNPGDYLHPLNSRLQTRPNMPPVIRISTPSSLSSVEVSSPLVMTSLGQGVVMSHPPQLPGSVTNNVAGVRLAQPQPGVRPAQPAIGSPQTGARSPQIVVRPPQPVSGSPLPGVRLPQPVIGSPQPGVRPPQPGVRPPQPVNGSPQVANVGQQQTSPVVSQSLHSTAPSSPGVRPVRGRGGMIRMRGGPRPGVRPRMPMRPGAPGPRGMRPRGPPPPGMRPVRPGQSSVRGVRPGMRPGGPRPGQPGAARPIRPVTQPVAAAPSLPPAPKPKPLKVEVVDLSDDDESPPPPPAAKSATLEKLKACGISISKQKAPTLPQGVRLPPGISLGSAGSSSAPKRSSSYNMSQSNGEPSNKRVAVNPNVASALASVASDPSEPKKKVEMELTDKQMDALKALGLL